MNIYLIESPFQMLCALDAKNSFPANRHVLIIRSMLGEQDRRQITHLSEYETWDSVIDYSSIPESILYTVNAFLIFYFRNFKGPHFECVFIGNYNRDWMHAWAGSIPFTSSYMLDDGTLTLVVQSAFEADDFSMLEMQGKSVIRTITDAIFSINSKRPSLMDIFTIFHGLEPLAGQKILSNRLEMVRHSNNNSRRPKSGICFVGSNMVGSNIVTEDVYIERMAAIRDHFKKENETVFYYPHRREMQSLQARISDLDIVVVTNRSDSDKILEFVLMEENRFHAIVSFYSTAIFSLGIFLKDAEFRLFEIPQEHIREEFLQNYQIILNYAKGTTFIDVIQC